MSEINPELSNEHWALAFVALLNDEIRKDVAHQVDGNCYENRNPNITLEIYKRELFERLERGEPTHE